MLEKPAYFAELRNGPAEYLKCVDGKYGILFRKAQLGPAGIKAKCFFCDVGPDTGVHVTECAAAILAVPPPARIACLRGSQRKAACLVLNCVDLHTRNHALHWMKMLLEWRRPKAQTFFQSRVFALRMRGPRNTTPLSPVSVPVGNPSPVSTTPVPVNIVVNAVANVQASSDFFLRILDGSEMDLRQLRYTAVSVGLFA